MALRHTLLPEFDHEMASTRKTLERVPEDRLAWKPHKKSWSTIELATHLANLPTWTELTLTQDAFDMAPAGEDPPRTVPLDSRKALLAKFDANVAAARKILAATPDEEFMKPWTLLAGGKTLFTQPRIGVLRSFVMNHSIHHRGQLSVYLRLNEVPVPAIYGPSADEGGM